MTSQFIIHTKLTLMRHSTLNLLTLEFNHPECQQVGEVWIVNLKSGAIFFPLSSDSPLGGTSLVFFFAACFAPSESCRLSTSDSDWRELCRPVWLWTLNRALLFLARSDSGADWLLSGSWLSGSEPTLTSAFRVLVRAEVTEPIAKPGRSNLPGTDEFTC